MLDRVVYCAFDGAWLHRRNSGEHFGVLTSENILHEDPKTISAFKVIAYKFISLDRVSQRKTGTSMVRAGNSWSQTSKGMEAEAILAIMQQRSAQLKAADVTLCMAVDGDLSTHEVLNGFKDILIALVRDFGHLRKGVIKLLADKLYAEFAHFQDTIVRWYTSCVYTGAQHASDGEPKAKPTGAAAPQNVNSGKRKAGRIESYAWTQDEFRGYFLNLPAHLQGDHSHCPKASMCSISAEYVPPEHNLLKCKDKEKINRFKKMLNGVLALSGLDVAMSDIRTCRAESFHSFRTTFTPKDIAYSVSAEARCCLAVSVLNDGFAETFAALLTAANITVTPQQLRLVDSMDQFRRRECMRAFKSEEAARATRKASVEEEREDRMPVNWLLGLNTVPMYGKRARTESTSAPPSALAQALLRLAPSPAPFWETAGSNTNLCPRCRKFPAGRDFTLCGGCMVLFTVFDDDTKEYVIGPEAPRAARININLEEASVNQPGTSDDVAIGVLNDVRTVSECKDRDARVMRTADHNYVVDSDPSVPYVSATELVARQFAPFDENMAANAAAIKQSKKRKGSEVDGESMKLLWKANRQKGETLHTRIDVVLRTGESSTDSIADDKAFANFLQLWSINASRFTSFRSEWAVFDEECGIAGTIDFVGFVAAREVEIWDWKRVAHIDITSSRGRTGLATSACKDVQDCNYSRYLLQLHIYARILERRYGLTVRRVIMVQLHPDQPEAQIFGLRDSHLDGIVEMLFNERKAARQQTL